MKRRVNFYLVFLVILVSASSALYYVAALMPNTHFIVSTRRFFIPHEMSGEEVIAKLSKEGIIKRSRTIRWYLKLAGQPNLMPGKYIIECGSSNSGMIDKFSSGDQESVEVRIRHLRDVSRIAGRLAQYLRADSLSFAEVLLDPARMDSIGFNRQMWPTFFFAGTYTMLWTDSPSKVFQRFADQYQEFWTEERKAKAGAIGMSPEQVYTLASIVKGEVMKTEEATKVAGLYLNRLRIGMALQSDPTVVFALGREESAQVTFDDLEVDSPYNTYKVSGLPPGPIFITEPVYLDAVLNHEVHNYLYMCAKPGSVGEHAFAHSFEEHLKNAEAYRKWRKNLSRQ